MKDIFQKFWAWYERNYILNVSIAAGLFLLQLVHLFWLGGDVIVGRLTGVPWFDLQGVWQLIITLVDYTEIPAIFSITLVYINEWRQGRRWHAILMLLLLHSQWLHIFWITDELVVDTFTGEHMHTTVLPAWLAWVAIFIDYLEVPVVIDTLLKLSRAMREKKGLQGIKEALDEDE